MLAFLQASSSTWFGSLCALAGFLVIVASVFFVIKGKVALGESGAPNKISWGNMKANLTSAVALFVLGAAMIALPYWLTQQEQSRLQLEQARQPASVILTGKINAADGKNVRLLLVEKPDYDQTYSGEIAWTVPLVAQKTSYSVFYVDGDTILRQESFTVDAAAHPGSAPQKVSLPDVDIQTVASASPEITPKLEVSNEQLKNLGVN